MLGFKLLDAIIHQIDPKCVTLFVLVRQLTSSFVSDHLPYAIPFLTLPSPTDYPDYYEIVKTPISLEQIRRRLLAREFTSFDQVRHMCEGLCRNAKRYNQSGSDIYEKARALHSFIRDAYADLVENGEVSSHTGSHTPSRSVLMQQSIKLSKVEKPDSKARLDFDEPSKGTPSIQLRLKRTGDIPYVEDEDRSFGQEVDEEQTPPQTDIPRKNIKRSSTAMDTDADSEEENEEAIDLSEIPTYDFKSGLLGGQKLDRSKLHIIKKLGRRKKNAALNSRPIKVSLRQCLALLNSALDKGDEPICEAFAELPSRKEYPDYYQVIQRPVSLEEIGSRINKGMYESAASFLEDIQVMINNAKTYNEDGSAIWDAAESIRVFVDRAIIPKLQADGFAIHSSDTRPHDLTGDRLKVRLGSRSATHSSSPGPLASQGEWQPAQQIQSQELSSAVPSQNLSSSPHSSPMPAEAPGMYTPTAGAPSQTYVPNSSPLAPQEGGGLPFAASSLASQVRPPTTSPLPDLPPPLHTPPQAQSFGLQPVNGSVPFPPQQPFFPGQAPGLMSAPGSHPSMRPSKRLQGDAPLDPFSTLVLHRPDKSTIVRQPVISHFTVQSAAPHSAAPLVSLRNTVTRLHSVNILARNKYKEDVRVQLRLRDIVSHTQTQEHPNAPNWKVHILCNGHPVTKVTYQNEHAEVVVLDSTTEANPRRPAEARNEIHSATDGLPKGTFLLPPSSICSFHIPSTFGTNILDVVVNPAAPNASLLAIANDTTDPQSHEAQSLLDIPERYRIFLLCT